MGGAGTIYGMRKTTIYLDESQDRALKAIARSRGISQAELIREAIDKLVDGERVRPLSIGIGRSGGGSIRDNKHEWLKGFGEHK